MRAGQQTDLQARVTIRSSSAALVSGGQGCCEICLYNKDHENLVACSSCSFCAHVYCLDPMLLNVPLRWHCPTCRDSRPTAARRVIASVHPSPFLVRDGGSSKNLRDIPGRTLPRGDGQSCQRVSSPDSGTRTKMKQAGEAKTLRGKLSSRSKRAVSVSRRKTSTRRRKKPKRQAEPVSSSSFGASEQHEALIDEEEEKMIKQAILNSLASQKKVSSSVLPLAPTFHPTLEEFKDPVSYLAKLHDVGVQYGALKIVPPKSWKPTFNIDPSNYRFSTRMQAVHELQQGRGFPGGGDYTLEEYQEMADKFVENYARFIREMKTLEEIEDQYWKIVNGRSGDVIVEYGNDIDSSLAGSGFSPAEKSKWNLEKIARLSNSPLSCLPDDIKGVTVPWVYCGMQFSTFCWHCEDHHLPSINYLHRGAPKIWYCVPSDQAEKLEEVMKRNLVRLFQDEPDLMHKLCTTLDPGILVANGIKVHKIIQSEGSFVVTFPRGYHSGFNTGFNVAEAVNFGYDAWFKFGNTCCNQYKLMKRPSVFSHPQLVLEWSRKRLPDIPDTVAKELCTLVDNFKRLRDRLIGLGIEREEKFYRFVPDRHQCAVCQHHCYLSCVRCRCSPRRHYCMLHFDKCEACPPQSKRLSESADFREFIEMWARATSVRG